MVSFSHPKALIFFGTVVASALSLEKLSSVEVVSLLGASSVALGAVFSLWALIAVNARQIFRHAGCRRLMNRVSAAVLAGTGIAIASR